MYINIHTHKKPSGADELIIRNGFLCNINYAHLNYYVSVGLHPWFVGKSINYLHLLTNAVACKNVIAIGECGLDNLFGINPTLQKEVFLQHIYVANTFKKPLILHMVKANHVLLELIKFIQVPVIIHNYNAGKHITRAFLNYRNIYFSLGLTSANNKNLLDNIPLNRIFFETDNKNISIKLVYQKTANKLNKDLNQLKQIITDNFNQVFGLV